MSIARPSEHDIAVVTSPNGHGSQPPGITKVSAALTVVRARKEITWTFGRRIGMRCEAR